MLQTSNYFVGFRFGMLRGFSAGAAGSGLRCGCCGEVVQAAAPVALGVHFHLGIADGFQRGDDAVVQPGFQQARKFGDADFDARARGGAGAVACAAAAS